MANFKFLCTQMPMRQSATSLVLSQKLRLELGLPTNRRSGLPPSPKGSETLPIFLMRNTMKVRSIALAGAAVLALGTPALADNPGWYLGFGAGYDQLQRVHARTVTAPSIDLTANYSGDAIYLASAGYKWESGIRTELELGFDSHDATKASAGEIFVTKPDLTGGTSTSTALLNVIYDWNITDRWGVSLGGGIGVGDVNHYERVGGASAVGGSRVGFEWQGIAGLDFSLAHGLALVADYRFSQSDVGNA